MPRLSPSFGKFDPELLRTNLFQYTKADVDYTMSMFGDGQWVAHKRKVAELEAHRERVRQVFARAFRVVQDSSEWAQAVQMVQDANTVDKLKKICDSFDIVWKDSGDMVTKNEEIKKLQDQIALMQKQLVKLELGRMGKEPANGAVFKIEKRFSKSGGASYVYAAVKAGGSWYLTGVGTAGSKIYTWEELKKFIGEYSRVWVMTAKEELVG